MISPTEDINPFEVLDDNHIIVTEGNGGWYFYNSDDIDANGNVASADRQLYETSAKAAFAACVYYGYV